MAGEVGAGIDNVPGPDEDKGWFGIFIIGRTSCVLPNAENEVGGAFCEVMECEAVAEFRRCGCYAAADGCHDDRL